MPCHWPFWLSPPPPQHVVERERRMAEKLTHGPGKRRSKRKARR